MIQLHGVSRYEKVKWEKIHIQFNEFWHTTYSRVYLELATIFYPEHSSFLGYDAISIGK